MDVGKEQRVQDLPLQYPSVRLHNYYKLGARQTSSAGRTQTLLTTKTKK